MNTPESLNPAATPTFPALATLSGTDPGLHPGRISVTAHTIRFEGAAGSLEWPLREVQIDLGGHDHRQLILTRVGVAHGSIHTSAWALLDQDVFRSEPWQEPVARLRRRSKALPKAWLAAGAVLLLFLAGLLALLLQTHRVAHRLAERVPPAWEQQIGQSIHEQVSRKSKLLTDHEAYNAQLRTVTNALLPALKGISIPFQFHIVEDTNLNAFAVPGGLVYVHTGLLSAVKRPEELAGVIAHEIAHVTQRHSLRKLIEGAGLWMVIRALLGDADGLLAIAGDTSQFLINQTFSRDFEREADDVGWDYLVAARIDPRGLIDVFATMKARQDNSSAGRLANALPLLSTHPATDERMNRLRAKWDATDRKEVFKPLAAASE